MQLRIVFDPVSETYSVLKRVMFFRWVNAANHNFKNGRCYPFKSYYDKDQLQNLNEDMEKFKEKLRLSRQKRTVVKELKL